jgi:hypothetical protein
MRSAGVVLAIGPLQLIGDGEKFSAFAGPDLPWRLVIGMESQPFQKDIAWRAFFGEYLIRNGADSGSSNDPAAFEAGNAGDLQDGSFNRLRGGA